MIWWLACSTPAPTPAPPDRLPQDLAYWSGTSWTSGRMSLVFRERGAVSLTWHGMKGDPVDGRIGSIDDSMHIAFDKEATNTLNRAFDLVWVDACTLRLSSRHTPTGVVPTETPFRRTVPTCP